MPSQKTQTTCPNCRQTVIMEVEQLFDLSEGPEAKQRLLSGTVNTLQCPNCRYQGPYPTPLVYHDPEKELLLTFMPPELGLAMDRQERVIGPMITKVMDRLPQERRKAYLLQPKTMLTMQTMVETILEADGISKEMVQAQQQRMDLLQRLANVTDDSVLEAIVKQEDEIVDREFFTVLTYLAENAAASGNQGLVQRLSELQSKLLPITSFGRELQQETQEVEAAIESLQAHGEDLTREKLLDLVVKAPNEARVKALVSLTRAGMDYQFFQMLSERIDRARGDGRKRLADLRETLLTLTQDYDRQLEAQMSQTRQFLENLLQAVDIRDTMMQNLSQVNQLFTQMTESELEAARKSGDLNKSGKLQKVMEVVQELAAPPPEVRFINQLVATAGEGERQKLLQAYPEDKLGKLVEALTGLIPQLEASGDSQLVEQIKQVYRQVLRYSMRVNLRKG